MYLSCPSKLCVLERKPSGGWLAVHCHSELGCSYSVCAEPAQLWHCLSRNRVKLVGARTRFTVSYADRRKQTTHSSELPSWWLLSLKTVQSIADLLGSFFIFYFVFETGFHHVAQADLWTHSWWSFCLTLPRAGITCTPPHLAIITNIYFLEKPACRR